MTVEEPVAESAVTELARGSRCRRLQPLARRALMTEVLVGGGFLAAAAALAVLGDGPTDIDAGPGILLVAALALTAPIYIEVGGSYTSPTQLIFVPMLFLLPTQLVPLFVVLALWLGALPDVARGRVHPDRLLHVPADCWFALGPAAVLVAFDVGAPEWDDWPIYLLALAAQIVGDVTTSTVREWLAEGTPPQLQLRVTATIQGFDVLLSPLGLLAAFASQSWDYAFLLLLPPTAMLVFYARERTRRLSSALQLSDAAREREALIASASHELVTPMAVLTGLTERLVGGSPLSPERRAQMDLVMHRETIALRQLVRQFVDYTRLKTDRELHLEMAAVDIGVLGAEVAPTAVPADLPPALADADRLHQMLTSLANDVVRETMPPATARIAASARNGRVLITVSGPARPRVEAFAEIGGSPGVQLYMTAELARLQGGTVSLAEEPGGGSRYTLELSAA